MVAIDADNPIASPLRPLNVVMIFLAGAVLFGGFLLLSAAESATLVDGAVEWQEESPLRAVVRLLCLDYRFATHNAGDFKGYVLGVGAGLALLAISIAVLAGGVGAEAVEVRAGGEVSRRRHFSPLVSAQILIALFVLWSFASSRWSPSSRISVGGSILLGIGVAWALCLSYGLTPRAAAIAGRILIVVTGITAVVAIWYYHGRNPTIRAKFPFGNPNFLSASLLPGILLCISTLVGGGTRGKSGDASRWWMVGAALASLGLGVWALSLSDSRGATAALVAGLGAMCFFMLPPRGRWVLAVLGVVAVALGVWWASGALSEVSTTGRSTTLRFRLYAWSYAWRMFLEKPLTGQGQGAFSMLGDSMVGDDVVADPPVFSSRIDHAHSEWLEVLAELGVVGFLLIIGALVLTFRAALRARGEASPVSDRATLIGLVGGLAALCAEECVGNGLRICELPVAFYTVLGLLWATCKRRDDSMWASSVVTPKTKPVLAVAGVILGVSALVVSQNDFQAAREAFVTDEHLEKGEDEEAMRAAGAAVDRLSPQRVLINLFRLASTQTIAAERLAARAADRDRRAREGDAPNPRLSSLAAADVEAMEQLCKEASHTLKTLITASPGFINHGQLEYRVNTLLARAAAWRGEGEVATAYMRNAGAALERELARQPFDGASAAEFVRLGGSQLEAETALMLLARPLRYSRITESLVPAILDFAGRDQAATVFAALASNEGAAGDAWRPEKQRIAAAVAFARSDYASAAALLEQAVRLYKSVAAHEAIGVASGSAELADARFYFTPSNPDGALLAAADAMALAPDSRLGRELRSAVRQRMVHYLLAKNDEESARKLLTESAPAGVNAESIEQELGTRYRRLCDSLIERRETFVLRKSAEGMLPLILRWSQRAFELAPKDPSVFVLAGDLALMQNDDDAAAKRYGEAIKAGWNPNDAAKYLDAILKTRAASLKLIEVRASLSTNPPP